MRFAIWRQVVQFSLMLSLAVVVGQGSAPVLFAQASPDAKDNEKEVDPVTKQLIAAHGLFERGLFKLAADEYVTFLEKNPKHAEATTARYALAICHYRLTKQEEAVKQLEIVLQDATFKQRDEALAVLGHCQLTLKNHAKALAAFDEILAKHAQSKFAEGAGLNRAQVLYMLDRKEEALAACKTFLDKHPKSSFSSNALYTLSITQHALKKYADAEVSLSKLLTDSPTTPYAVDALLLLAQSQEALGKLDQSAANFTKMIERAPVSRQAEGRYRLAVVLHNSGKHDEAIKQLKIVLADANQTPFVAPARLQLGKTQYDANKIAEGRKTLGEVVAKDSERADEAQYWLAQCDIAEKKYDAALKLLDALAAKKPEPGNIEDIQFFRAVCWMQMDKPEQAAAAFGTFITSYAKSPRTTEAMHHQAFCLHKLEKYNDSSKLCEAITKTGDTTWHYAAEKLWAENLFLAQQYPAASQKYTQILSKATTDDDKLQIQSRIAQSAYFAGDFKQAAALLAPLAANEAIAKSPQLRRVIFLQGDALLQTGDFKAAVAPLTNFLKLEAKDEEARYKLGLAQQRGGDEDAALASYALVITGKPETIWVQHAMLAYGQITYRKKQPDKAGPALSKVVAVKAEPLLLAPAMYLLAWIDFDAKKYEPAAAQFEQVFKQFPTHELAADAMYQRAICLNEAGKTEDSLAALKAYSTTHPKGKNITQAQQLTGAALAKLGRHDEAAKMLSSLAGDAASRSDLVLYDLAWSQRTLKNIDGAIKAYQDLIAGYKESKLLTPARVELAELLYGQEKFAEAGTLLEQAVADKNIDAKTLAAANYRLGWCHAKANSHAKAAAAFAAFIATNPKDALTPSALYQAGMAYRASGKLAEAQQQFAALVTQHPQDELAPTALLRQGETQAEASEYPQSAKSYQQFVAAHPKSEFVHLAHFGIGWAAEQQKQYDAARAAYTKVIEVTNTETAARAQFQIGETHFAQKNYELAAKELLKVEIVYAYPAWSAKALYEAGQAFEQLNQHEEARAQYERCVANYTKEPAADLAKKRLDALKSAGR